MRNLADPTQYLGTCLYWMADAFFKCGCPWFGRLVRYSSLTMPILAQIQECRAADMDMERWRRIVDWETYLTRQNPLYVSHIDYGGPL